jgi:linoleoyl-CoA desaturase
LLSLQKFFPLATIPKKLDIVRFAPRNGEGFYDTLKKRVEVYFKDNNIEMHGNKAMFSKTPLIIAMYLLPYFVMVSGIATANLWVFYGLWILMGVGMAGIGCAVMHDSNHGSYSNSKNLNKYMGKIIALVGGYEVTWKIQHNVLHHTYTNIEGLDDDIDAGIFLRFSPHSKKYWAHRYQHLYAWFLYGLLTLQWATIKDFRQVYDYHKKDLLRKEKTTLGKAMLQLSIYKILYYAYIFVIPVVVTGIAWQNVLIGFVIMHFVAGLLLSCIFQLAHVMETSEYPLPTDDRKMENNWAIHQLLNTANFSPKSKSVFWFVGGLNHQIEHHLFPHICHIHYKQVAVLVEETANEYGLPYQVQPSFVRAVIEHGRMLRKLGRS